MFWCSFACKATIASTEGHAVTFILQSVLKEAWKVSGRRLAAARYVIFLPVFHRWLKIDACCALLQATHILEVWKLLMPERHHKDLFLFYSPPPRFLIDTKLHECAISCRSVKTQLHKYDDDPPSPFCTTSSTVDEMITVHVAHQMHFWVALTFLFLGHTVSAPNQCLFYGANRKQLFSYQAVEQESMQQHPLCKH